MIYQEINKERLIYKFIFTGRHIYCYLHAIAETSEILAVINKIIINYDNKELIKQLEEQLTIHTKRDEILLAIENMLTRKPVTYTEQIDETKLHLYKKSKLTWFNNLYLDQNSSNIMPPIPILESIQQ
jgi:hypothetical protein